MDSSLFIISWPPSGWADDGVRVQASLPDARCGEERGTAPAAEVVTAVDEMRADYEHQLDARYAAARGYVDAIVFPENTREMLSLALRATLHNPGPHLGPFVLPPHLGETS